MKTIFVLIFLLFPLLLAAQEVPKDLPEPGSDDTAEISVMPGEFVYNPEGRRDPFWNLLQGKSVKENREAIEGIAGLMIDELELEGIIFRPRVFQGPAERPRYQALHREHRQQGL